MEYADIELPLEYWEQRKEFLKQARRWFIFGKVRMIKKKESCAIIFYHNTSLYYLVNGAVNFGAWLKSKGYRTYHNAMIYESDNHKI